MFAHGLNLTPDLGTPEETSDWPKRENWTSNTISHNTVLVDEQPQEKQWVSEPKGFDHTDRVQLFDVDASNVYSQVDAYRRTVAQITVDTENSYAVDFFRVDGGTDHHFSFHGAQLQAGSVSTAQSQTQNTNGASEVVVRDGGDSVRSVAGGDIVITNGSGDDWRGLSLPAADSNVRVTTTISAALRSSSSRSEARTHWPVNQSVYLGRDAGGQHVCAGLGRPAPDVNPRFGILYPERGEWGEHEELTGRANGSAAGLDELSYGPGDDGATRANANMDASTDIATAWARTSTLTLRVTVEGVRVTIALGSGGSTLAERTFTLTSTTADRVGVFGAVGPNQTGQLRFQEFRVDGAKPMIFTSAALGGGPATTGLSLSPQKGGSYAGPDIPKPEHGETTAYNKETGNGFNYLHPVRRDDSPDSPFSVDWHVSDFWNARSANDAVHLRLTMVEEMDDVALANGDPPQRWGNPETFTYLLAHRSGERSKELTTTFTSVIEPYTNSRFVGSISDVSITGSDTDRAVKVELANGRTDYIASAADQTKSHTVGDVFAFTGRFAVYAENEAGTPAFAYLFDGTRLAAHGRSPPLIQVPSGRIEGTVESFTRDLSSENSIEVDVTSGLAGDRSVMEMKDNWLYADSDPQRNGAYRITNVTQLGTHVPGLLSAPPP